MLALALAASAAATEAELRSVRIAAAADHCAAERWLLGDNWRALWSTPVALPVLDLERAAGGLRPVEIVGGYQTLGLALEGADDRSYTFRSLEKWGRNQAVPGWLRWGPVRAIFDDQATANLPGADLVVARLSRRVGVRATPQRLVLMPDDPALGPYRALFAHRAGTLSEYARAGEDGDPGTFGATEIASSGELWQHHRAGDAPAVDARAYLRARLLDWWVGDWDRHPGQWRWARVSGESGWQPIPGDHDHAFSNFDGTLVVWVRLLAPWLGPFDADSTVGEMSHNSRWLDTWLLAGLDRSAWEEEIARFRDRDAESLAREALAGLPEPWRRQSGEDIRRVLAARWAALPELALASYASLARVVHLHGSDGDDRVAVHCRRAGPVEVTLARGASDAVLRRTFLPEETQRIALHLYGGDDRVEHTGAMPCAIEVTREIGPLRLERGVPAPVGERRSGKPGRRPRSRPL